MVDQVFLTIRTPIRCATVCFLAYMVFCVSGVLAGRSTSVLLEATIGAVADFKLIAPSIVAAIAGTGWYRERRLRQDNTWHMAPRIERLEKRMDPSRSSSALTKEGKTNPMDRES
jgi:hypothetical protein